MLWVIEAKSVFFRKWNPVLNFPSIPGVHRVRKAAREAKREMASKNQYSSVSYRVTKYEAALRDAGVEVGD